MTKPPSIEEILHDESMLIKQEKGRYITCIGTLNSQDQFLLDLLIENGFLLQKCVLRPSYVSCAKEAKENAIVSYKIYMEDNE